MRRALMGRTLSAAAMLPVLLLSACSSDGPGPGPIQVFAAASLTETFTEIGERFHQETGVEVAFNFAGSSDLAAQLDQGAPADVFAAADEDTMDQIVDAGLTGSTPVSFASNTLTLVTPPGNPAGVTGLADLTGDDVVTVVCAPQVPCGAATQRLAAVAGVELSPASEESAVTDVLGKVRAGEADAGIVYITDAAVAAEDVEQIDLPESEEVVNHYPIATLESSADPAAQEFVAFVEGDQGQEVLREAGFGRP